MGTRLCVIFATKLNKVILSSSRTLTDFSKRLKSTYASSDIRPTHIVFREIFLETVCIVFGLSIFARDGEQFSTRVT